MKTDSHMEGILDRLCAEVLNVSEGGGGRHRVLKIRHHGENLVLKCYGRKEKPLRVALRQFGSLFLVGKSSITARSRFATEREVIRLWEREGFDVPRLRTLPDPALERLPCLAMEWIPGTTLARMLMDPEVDLARKRDAVQRFAAILGRRHARALDLKEPRLLFENPTLEHVFSHEERLVHHDFEIVFTRKRDIERLVRRELVGFLSSLAKLPGETSRILLEDLAARYPDPGRLERVQEELSRYGGVPPIGWIAPILLFLPRRKRHRKRAPLARTLGEILTVRDSGFPPNA